MYKKSKVLREIRENLAKGAGVFNACEASGVKYVTVWTWRNRRPLIERYFQKILMQRVQLVEDALYKGALEGNTTAQIFYLKNRGHGWKDTPLIENKTTINEYTQIYRPEPYTKKQVDTTSRTSNRGV